MNKISIAALLAGSVLALAACGERDEPIDENVEQFGDDVGDTMEEAGDEVEEAGDDIEDELRPE